MRYAAGGGRPVRHEGQLQVRTGQVGLRQQGGDELVQPLLRGRPGGGEGVSAGAGHLGRGAAQHATQVQVPPSPMSSHGPAAGWILMGTRRFPVRSARPFAVGNPAAVWAGVADRGSITANHFDDVHISVF